MSEPVVLLTSSEAAGIIGCDVAAIRRLVKRDKLHVAGHRHRTHLFDRAEVEQLVGTVLQRDTTGKCGLCNKPFNGTEELWGPLRVRVHAKCVPKLNLNIQQVRDERYCPICGSTKVADVDGLVECLCVGTFKEKVA